METPFNATPFQLQRLHYMPKLPEILLNLRQVGAEFQPHDTSQTPQQIKDKFPQTIHQPAVAFKKLNGLPAHTPKRVGVVLSGGQAPGGHNVIVGLYDALQTLHHESRLFGFLGGPSGIVNNQTIEITRDIAQRYRNQGGFDMIGSGRTKIETPEQFQAALKTVDALQLDAIVIIGGDDSNTNAAHLAEFFKSKGLNISVIGVPKTIDGDLKNEYIETSFGFDTASKTYSDIIANIAKDAISAKKYYHFIKLMGRSASHITLECALQTHPNFTLIAEEVAASKKTLHEITNQICDIICQRAEKGKDYGVVLLPEGVIEFIPEFKRLIADLNTLLSPELQHGANLQKQKTSEERLNYLKNILSADSYTCLLSIPAIIQDQLLLDRDPHGNVQVSKIETERMFIAAVSQELEKRKNAGKYNGKFNAQPHFLGYEGRSCYPSNFDSQYCYSLGHVAALLIQNNLTGYMASVTNLTAPVAEWECSGIPLTSMLALEERQGKQKIVIEKALVDLKGAPFRVFDDLRGDWQIEDDYRFPGPIQFSGLPVVTESITLTLALERNAAGILETV